MLQTAQPVERAFLNRKVIVRNIQGDKAAPFVERSDRDRDNLIVRQVEACQIAISERSEIDFSQTLREKMGYVRRSKMSSGGLQYACTSFLKSRALTPVLQVYALLS